MKPYRAAVIGCSRMGGFIDNELANSPRYNLLMSHAAGFTHCARTELIACADLRSDIMAEFGRQYHIPAARQYTDYRDMIEREELDIVSVATQPEPRAEIVIYAANHGVRAIYAEKAFAPSLEDADAMVNALEENNVILNLGTNRRWSDTYAEMKAVIDSGELGALTTLIAYNASTLFNMTSHMFDLLLYLNNDEPVEWVQATLSDADEIFSGDILRADPRGEGMFHFANGVRGWIMHTPRGVEFEAICENGVLSALNDGMEWQLRKRRAVDPPRHSVLHAVDRPATLPASSTVRLIEDLVESLDSGRPPRGGARVALQNQELIFAFIESHRRGGSRVSLPLDHRSLRLRRDLAPKQPKFIA